MTQQLADLLAKMERCAPGCRVLFDRQRQLILSHTQRQQQRHESRTQASAPLRTVSPKHRRYALGPGHAESPQSRKRATHRGQFDAQIDQKVTRNVLHLQSNRQDPHSKHAVMPGTEHPAARELTAWNAEWRHRSHSLVQAPGSMNKDGQRMPRTTPSTDRRVGHEELFALRLARVRVHGHSRAGEHRRQPDLSDTQGRSMSVSKEAGRAK